MCNTIKVFLQPEDCKKLFELRHGSCMGLFFHSCSIDEAHNYKFCSDSELSWCNDKRALALAGLAPPTSSFSLFHQCSGEGYASYIQDGQVRSCFAVFRANPKMRISLNSKIWLLCHQKNNILHGYRSSPTVLKQCPRKI